MMDFTPTGTGNEDHATPDGGLANGDLWSQFPVEHGPDLAMYLLEACDEASNRGESVIDVSELIAQTAEAVRSSRHTLTEPAAPRTGLHIMRDDLTPQLSTGTTEPLSPEPHTTAPVLALIGGLGTSHEDEPIEIETTTSDGLPLILTLAPGYSREDVFAELPRIRRTVEEARDRLRARDS